jgi:hypothetical protein
MTQFLKESGFRFFLLSSILTIGTGLLFVSCQSSETTKPDFYTQTSAPSDFQLMIGEGGGFTGQWNGYVVDSTGTVSTWRGSSPDQNVKRTVKLARQQFDRLWRTIANARFFDIDTIGTGNMTVAMQVTANGTVHRASWAKPSGTRSHLAPVQVLYDSCRTIVSRVK